MAAFVVDRKSEVTVDATVNQWGNSLAVRLGKAVATVAGAAEGSPIRVSARPGQIVIDVGPRVPSLEEMLASYKPEKHGGEAMAFKPVGREVL